jgi:hypothetical protein
MIFFDTEGVYNHRWTLSVRTLVVTESLEPLAFVVVLSTCFKPFFEFHNSHESKAVEKHSAFTSESKTGLSSQCPWAHARISYIDPVVFNFEHSSSRRFGEPVVIVVSGVTKFSEREDLVHARARVSAPFFRVLHVTSIGSQPLCWDHVQRWWAGITGPEAASVRGD